VTILLRDPEAAKHGVYNISDAPSRAGHFSRSVALWHQPVKLRYEFSIYNAGKPAWETADKTGCLDDHTQRHPPASRSFPDRTPPMANR